ncbi:MAG TPA: DoxX family membrane protein [Thiotrichaceae bacterium]|nr:DoxX family membrane protein [Thiotrichaceae bacterium]HIL39568.1 DoxX family membrane protein [Methylococcales bacterium]
MIKTLFINHYLRAIPRVFVGLILISTGIGKALDMPGFVTILDGYQLLPYWFSVLLAYLLPFIELGVGISLLIAFKRCLIAWLAVLIHVLMLSVILWTLYRGIEVANCGCFGVFFARPLTPLTAIEDIVMLSMSLLALLDAKTRE